MSEMMGSAKSKNAPPPPPPPPPPLKSVSNDERGMAKVKTKPNASQSIPLPAKPKLVGEKAKSPPEKKSRSPQATTSPLVLSDGSSTPSTSPKLSSKSTSGSNSKSASGSNSKSTSKSASNSKSSGSGSRSPQKSPQRVSSGDQIPSKSNSRRGTRGSDVEIKRNEVPFFDEQNCTDSEDEFNFTCCLPPNAPRFPKNPRPYREWDPSFLPANTNIPTSIGRKCRRCGKSMQWHMKLA